LPDCCDYLCNCILDIISSIKVWNILKII
jgi:hypothetical protein